MCDNNKLDSFIDGIDESAYIMDKKVKEEILNTALNKITLERSEIKQKVNN